MPIISEQVKILLDRMDMHPDEFVQPYESRNINSKWGEVLDEGTFNRVERFLIKRKVRALKRKVTQDLILATIMYDEPPQRGKVSWSSLVRIADELEIENKKNMKVKK
jgi:hypothetical protein